MTSAFLVATIVAIVYLMVWMIQNDGARRIEDQRGLLRFIRPKGQPAEAQKSPAAPAQPNGPPPPSGRSRRDNRSRSQPIRPRPGHPPARNLPAADVPGDAEEEIIHPLWRGRPRKHRP
jgi:hypothetical protein